MDFNQVIQHFWRLETVVLGSGLDNWLLILARILTFCQFAPVLGRKDVPFEARLGLSIFLSMALFFLVPGSTNAAITAGRFGPDYYTLLLVMNVTAGALLGFAARILMETVTAAGAFATNQIGLQAANVIDPNTKQQNPLLGSLFGFVGVLLFIEIGGIRWLLEALLRSFTVFPLTSAAMPFTTAIPQSFWVALSSTVMSMGLLIAGPFFVVTMTVDIMLGIVNRAAQQIPVFQLSFALKPVIGIIVFLLTFPALVSAMKQYFTEYHLIF